MASFLDTTPKFSPYVQTTPYETMAKVGMLKQKQYDEGVQKIQGYVDQIAGLDIYKTEDQNYVKSAITSVGEKTKHLAGADFSEQQVVDSVAGQISKISKDKVVQTAVYSTQNIRKGDKEMEEERVSGKGGVENETYWGKLKQSYLNDGQTGSYFGQKYFKYRDINKRLKEIASEVGVDSKIVQNLFNPDGTLNKVMVETMVKGKDVNKIYQAFTTGLGPDDYKQISITGQYKYQSLNGTDLVNTLTESNNEFIKSANSRLLDIKEKISEYEKLKLNAKPENLKQINEEIASLTANYTQTENNILETQKGYGDIVSKIETGEPNFLDSVRGKIYTNKFLNTMSYTFSEKESYVKYDENPLWKANFDERKFAHDVWKDKQDLAYKYASLNEQKEANKLKKIELGLETVPRVGPIEGEEEEDTEGRVMENYNRALSERDARYQAIGEMALKQAGFTNPQAEAEKNGKIYSKTPQEWLVEYGRNAYTKIIRGGNIAVAPEYQQAFSEIGKYNNNIAKIYKTTSNINEQAAALSGNTKINYSKVEQQLKPEAFTINTPDSDQPKTVVLTPSQIVDFIKYNNLKRIPIKNKEQLEEFNQIVTKLDKTFTPEGRISLALKTSWEGRYSEKSAQESQVIKAQKLLSSEGYDKFVKAKKEIYKQTFSNYFPSQEAMSMSGTAKDKTITKISNVFGSRDEITEIKTALEGKDAQVIITATPDILGFGPTKPKVFVIGEKGTVTKSYDITPDDYTYLTGKQLPQVNTNLNLFESYINSNKDGSSNSQGAGNPETAYYTKQNFTNVKKYNVVGGDIVRDKINGDNYFFHLYLNNNGIIKSVPIYNEPLSLEKAQQYPLMITDAVLDKILTNK
jgi:hypothetical protein